MPAASRPQFPGGSGGGGRVRPQAGLADGLRGYHGGVQAHLGKAGSLLLERDSRAGKSDERKCGGLDLEKIETQIAAAYGNCRGRDLHGTGGLSRVKLRGRERKLKV